MYAHLNDTENALLNHISMWGSDGYPVKRCGSRHWSWSYREISTSRVYGTKREAIASFEAYHEILLDRAALRIA